MCKYWAAYSALARMGKHCEQVLVVSVDALFLFSMGFKYVCLCIYDKGKCTLDDMGCDGDFRGCVGRGLDFRCSGCNLTLRRSKTQASIFPVTVRWPGLSGFCRALQGRHLSVLQTGIRFILGP